MLFLPGCRLTLAQVNPLMHDCLELKEGGRMEASFEPSNLRWPSETGRLRVAPLKLELRQGQLLSEVLALARLNGPGLPVRGRGHALLLNCQLGVGGLGFAALPRAANDVCSCT